MIDQLLIMISSEKMATIRYRGAESLVAIKQIFVPKPDPAGRAAFYLSIPRPAYERTQSPLADRRDPCGGHACYSW